MSSLPPVTVSMISLNDEDIITECLKSIRDQNYPQEKLFIQIFDGGSTDNTVSIAKSYNAKVIVRTDLKDKPSERGCLALLEGNTALRVFFSADNRFGSKNTLKEMVEAQVKFNSLGTITLRYKHVPSSAPLSRYFALIGGSDPLVIFLGLNDRLAFDDFRFRGLGEIVHSDQNSCLVRFKKTTQHFPTLGANGFLYNIGDYFNSKYAQKALHIDMCFDANLRSNRGFSIVLNETINHEISIPLFNFLKRRISFANSYKNEDGSRNYEIYNSDTRFKCILFAICSLLIVPHFYRSLRGFLYKPDWAWFLHPLVCLAYTVGYLFMFFERKVIQK